MKSCKNKKSGQMEPDHSKKAPRRASNKNKYNTECQPLFLQDGRTAGYAQGTTFLKYVQNKNILYRPPALCLNQSIFQELEGLQVETIEVRHKHNGNIWSLPLIKFKEKAFPINRGIAGAQFCVRLQNWITERRVS